MRNVRADIIRNLQIALEECNLATVQSKEPLTDSFGSTWAVHHLANDLPNEFACSTHAFGAITAALKLFGGEDMVENWFETGQWDIDDRFYDPRQALLDDHQGSRSGWRWTAK